jgi:hypothetical protein
LILVHGELLAVGRCGPDDPSTRNGKGCAQGLEQVHDAARGGLDIPAYFKRPRGAVRENLPLVVRVHGDFWNRLAKMLDANIGAR